VHGPSPRLAGPALVGALVAAGVTVVGLVNPEIPGHYPVCPTYALTGFYCPGCGGLRAVHALAHGDVGLALHRNLLLVVALPFLGWAYLAWIRRRALGRPPRWMLPAALWWAAPVVLVAFTVVRNLPAFGVLAP
jgi:Protein of unknown function (DUF2752)